MNCVILIGRLTRDPELKYTPGGDAVCSFAIAVDRRFSKEKEADFIDIVAWKQSAEFAANYLAKGRLVSVQGRLQVRSWVQQDGTKRWKAEVVAEQLQGLDKQQGQQAVEQPSGEDTQEYDPFSDTE